MHGIDRLSRARPRHHDARQVEHVIDERARARCSGDRRSIRRYICSARPRDASTDASTASEAVRTRAERSRKLIIRALALARSARARRAPPHLRGPQSVHHQWKSGSADVITHPRAALPTAPRRDSVINRAYHDFLERSVDPPVARSAELVVEHEIDRAERNFCSASPSKRSHAR
jgi:hypothetical protein